MFRSKPLYDNWCLGGGQESMMSGFIKPKAIDMFAPLDSGNNDLDANSFILGAGITDGFQKIVIHELVKNLKAAALWDKILVAYPCIGGTGSRHGMNLKNYTTFNATFTNAPTHNSLGITFNGTNQYMNTLFNPLSVGMNKNYGGMAIYWQNTSSSSGIHGCDGSSNEYFWIATSICVVTCFNTSPTVDNPNIIMGNNLTNGFVLSSRISNTPFAMLNKKIVSRTIASGAVPNRNVYFGCRNSSGTPSNYAAGTLRFACVHSGLTTNEAITFNNIIQRYQERLGREIKNS